MRVTTLAGGVGGAAFLSGLRDHLDGPSPSGPSSTGPSPAHELTAVVNTGDDITMHGLRITPDLDSVMYTLSGQVHTEQGWGRRDETFTVSSELAAFGEGPDWFTLGDRDVATHVLRTRMLAEGATASAVVARLCERFATGVRLLPMSDDPVETYVEIADAEAPDGRRPVHFQEYWVRLHAGPEALAIRQVGIEAARPAPGVVEALAAADLVLVGPSNPVVSIGPILGVPGIRAAVRTTPAPVIGFSGILHGAPVLGMAHRLLPTIGVAVDAAAVGRHYGARSADGVLDAWVVDTGDAGSAAGLEADGLPTVVDDLIMSSPAVTAGFVRRAVERVTA